MKANLPEQVWDRIKVGSPDECWEWQGSKNHLGYGVFSLNGLSRKPHRVVLELAGHTLSPSDVVMHLCDNRACANPGHLRIGTQAENIADMISKGRGLRNEAHPQARLTNAQVAEIRAASKRGETQRSIARSFGVSQSTVWRISHNVSRVL